jgi:hypothetical protein
MKASSGVLWGIAAVLVIIAIALSCANGAEPSCDTVTCQGDCRRNGFVTGVCDRGACSCTESTGPDADADADADADVAPDLDTHADDARDFTPVDDSGGSEGSTEGGGEAKSGCDPLICFLSCGGPCTLGGACVCEAPTPGPTPPPAP